MFTCLLNKNYRAEKNKFLIKTLTIHWGGFYLYIYVRLTDGFLSAYYNFIIQLFFFSCVEYQENINWLILDTLFFRDQNVSLRNERCFNIFWNIYSK